MTKEISDLYAQYTGGFCHELALWFAFRDPERYRLWEATSRINWDGRELGYDCTAHWFVEDLRRHVFFDAYGDCGRKPADVLKEWPDFRGDTTVKYTCWPDVKLAHKRMIDASCDFRPDWEARAESAACTLNLI